MGFADSSPSASGELNFTKSRAIWSTALSDNDRAPEQKPTSRHRTIPKPRPHTVAAITIAMASMVLAVALLILAPDETGITASGAVATAGLSLAGRLAHPPR
ncbi:hypothetical protein ACH4S8_40750 [Streptomyces sp. NPDC021080]|uniref:hypothetical protein n=1 Tax=Streptomyces sp. NPDC021080 TaxID=3365110 RepID=UPI0037B6EE63